MSTFWETYKKQVEEGADKLSKPPKDISQHILWLKAYVSERMDKEGLAKYVGDSSVENTFGFKESFVNYLMHYAYEAGIKSNEHNFNRSTENMRKALDDIKNTLDNAGWIDYPEY
jgi:hypothetical protein